MGASISTTSIDSCSSFLSDLDFTINNTTENAEKFNVSQELLNMNDIEISNVNKSKIFANIDQEIDASIAYNFMSTFNEILNANDNIKENANLAASTVGEVLQENLSFLDNFAQIKGSSASISSKSEYVNKIKQSTLLTTISKLLIKYSGEISGTNKILITNISDSEIDITANQKLAQKMLTKIDKVISKELTKILGVDVVSNIDTSTNGTVKNSSITWIIVAIVAAVIVIIVIIIAPILKDLANKKASAGSTAKTVEKTSADSIESAVDKQSI